MDRDEQGGKDTSLPEMFSGRSHVSGSLRRKKRINELNVFPVLDGDTGTEYDNDYMSAASEVKQSRSRYGHLPAKAISPVRLLLRCGSQVERNL